MAGDDPLPAEIGGYVLAGGKSSRMGADKALLELGGEPLIRHAVKKLRRVCMDVRICSDDPALEAYAPCVPDLHPGCGPISGMEAGLAHSIFDWNLFLTVDMPFVPSALLWFSLRTWLQGKDQGARIRLYQVDGRPQPGFCLLHREVLPFLTEAIARGEHKLMLVFQQAGRALAERHGFLPGAGLWCAPFTGLTTRRGPRSRSADWCFPTDAQQAAERLWFANLNTPDEFAEAEAHLDALDT